MQESREPRSFLVWGGGGHAKVVADLLRTLGHVLTGHIDADPAKLGQVVEPGGASVVWLQDEWLAAIADRSGDSSGVDALALGVGDNAAREAGFRRFGGLVDLPPLIHPSAVVSPSAEIGRGTVVFGNAVVNAGTRVGSAVIINSGAIVEHDCVIEAGGHVSPGAVLCGGVHLGTRSWICAGATVVPGIKVGADCIVGGGATVIANVQDGETVAGTPARPILERTTRN